MKKITFDQFDSVLKAKKAILFIHNPGCVNCLEMQAHVEEYELENKDVEVMEYALTGPTDPLFIGFDLKVFPGIYAFQNGVMFWGTQWLANKETIGIGFKSPDDLFPLESKTGRNVEKLKKEIKKAEEKNFLINHALTMYEEPKKFELKKKPVVNNEVKVVPLKKTGTSEKAGEENQKPV